MKSKVLKFLTLFVLIFSMITSLCVVSAISAPDYEFNIDVNGQFTIQQGSIDDNGERVLTDISAGTSWTHILNEYNGIIKLIYGLFLLTCIIIFIVNFVKIGGTGSNPHARQACMTGIIVSGIGTALLGGLGIFFQYAYNFFG